MCRLGPISRPELVRRFRRLGFEGPFAGGKHEYMAKGALVVTLPNPHWREIGPELLSRILRQAGIPRKQWR
ncbi:MAG: type II toxin-antitoxin system HicA family toxin [Planctomycetota bacterium]|nr:type II toxin-antitoxin system HicA family toxin [Planctomycetota bacterium]